LLIFYGFFTISAFGVALFDAVLKNLFTLNFTSEVIYEVLSAIAYFISFSGAAFILRRMCRSFPTATPIYTSFKPQKWIFAAIVSAIAVNFSFSYLNTKIFTLVSPMFEKTMASSSSNLEGRPMSEVAILFVLAIFSTAIVPAICEEYLFRGAILGLLLPFGRTAAIIGSSVLFGFMHQNPLQLFYTVFMGVILGYIYVKTKSIWACVLLHFFNNLITVVEDFLPVFTGVEWIVMLVDFLVLAAGAICLVALIFKKDKQPQPDTDGSFGRLYEVGVDVEEFKLDMTVKEKIRSFFAPTVIVYLVICALSILGTLVLFMGFELPFDII
jgi:membrane protease YdiL (CAAX protease family)